jgi:hypothetical protein
MNSLPFTLTHTRIDHWRQSVSCFYGESDAGESGKRACLPDIDIMLTYMPDSQSVTNALMFSYHGIASAKEIRESLFFARTHRRELRVFPSLATFLG